MPSLPPIRPEDVKVAERSHSMGAFDEPEAVEAHPDPLEDAYYQYLLRLGDDALILGQRLGEWCGHAPSVEVDLSLANFALDLIGQATHFLNRAGEVEGKGRDGDALALNGAKPPFPRPPVLEGRVHRRRRGKGSQGSHLPPGAGVRMGGPSRRR